MSVLLRKTDFQSRAWNHTLNEDLLRLTTKILFNSKNNFKTINLCMTVAEASLVCNVSSPPVWMEWLIDFFTVVEYPVMGYIPPAILTELHMEVKHSTVDVPKDDFGRVTLAMGNTTVMCSLLDTGKDASISITLEDLGLYLSSSKNSNDAN